MKVITLQSLQGGAGGTSLTANLSAACRRRGHSVVAVDLNPANELRLHFGMPLDDGGGLIAERKQLQALDRYAYQTDDGEVYIPFGLSELSTKALKLDELQQLFESLQSIKAAQGELLVFVDIASYDRQLAFQCAAWSTMMLHIIEPDPRAYPVLQRFGSGFLQALQTRCRDCFVLLNKSAPQLELNRDIFDLLRAELNPELLIPTFIQRDQHVPEALATQQSIFNYSLGAQANVDLMALAQWLERQLGIPSP